MHIPVLKPAACTATNNEQWRSMPVADLSLKKPVSFQATRGARMAHRLE
jgi:hypothetical protein